MESRIQFSYEETQRKKPLSPDQEPQTISGTEQSHSGRVSNRSETGVLREPLETLIQGTIANRIIEECNPLCILEDKTHSSVTLDSFWIQIASERVESESGQIQTTLGPLLERRPPRQTSDVSDLGPIFLNNL